MSEMRRMARVLVERRSEAFASRYPRAESERRVQAVLAGFAPKGLVYEAAWRDEPGGVFLDVAFAPARSTRVFLYSSSAAFTVLLAFTLWSLVTPGEMPASRLMVAIGTLGAILAFPFVVLGYASRREAEEATLRRKLRKAIVEAEDP